MGVEGKKEEKEWEVDQGLARGTRFPMKPVSLMKSNTASDLQDEYKKGLSRFSLSCDTNASEKSGSHARRHAANSNDLSLLLFCFPPPPPPSSSTLERTGRP